MATVLGICVRGEGDTGADVTTIPEYLGTIQASFLEVWKMHLLTSNFHAHIVLNEYYDGIIDLADDLIEHYMGLTGEKLPGLENCLHPVNNDAVDYFKRLRDYVRNGKHVLGGDDMPAELSSDIDAILGLLDSTIYKLRVLINEGREPKFGHVPTYGEFVTEAETFDVKENEGAAEYEFSFENENGDIYAYNVLFEVITGTNDVRARFNFNVNGEEYDTANDEFAGLDEARVEQVVETIGEIIETYLQENRPERIVIHTDGQTMQKKFRLFVNFATHKFGEECVEYNPDENTIYIMPEGHAV